MKHSTIRTVIELKQRRANQQIDKKNKNERVIIILRRITRDYNQDPADIPPLFCPLVYKELHVDMGHLGVDRI